MLTSGISIDGLVQLVSFVDWFQKYLRAKVAVKSVPSAKTRSRCNTDVFPSGVFTAFQPGGNSIMSCTTPARNDPNVKLDATETASLVLYPAHCPPPVLRPAGSVVYL